jgi:hypothetical protein
MDFVGPLPESDGANFLMVVIDRLTSMVHLIPMRSTATAADVAWQFLDKIIKLHGYPRSIVSDRDSRFTSRFWSQLQASSNTKLLMSTAFHPQTDGATERANRTIGQILRSLVRPDQGDWFRKIPLVEIAINASINASSKFSPFELMYGFPPRFSELGDAKILASSEGVRNFVEQARWNLLEAHDNIISQRVRSEHHANLRRREPSQPYKVGQLVFLSTENLNIPETKSRKLAPRFIGPFKILRIWDDSPNVMLELPKYLRDRRIHPTFHIKLLRPYIKSDDSLFPNRDLDWASRFEETVEGEWHVDEILDHRFSRTRGWEFRVLWTLGDRTWEPLVNCNDLQALDEYLRLRGCLTVDELPRVA